MLMPDVNVLVHAHRADSSRHEECAAWLDGVINSPAPFAYAELVSASFVRVVTHRRVFNKPSSLEEALAFADTLMLCPNAVVTHPGPRHWAIFTELCRAVQARGNLITDAYLAALAIEHGAEWVSIDRDFARFPGLNWRTPFQSPA